MIKTIRKEHLGHMFDEPQYFSGKRFITLNRNRKGVYFTYCGKRYYTSDGFYTKLSQVTNINYYNFFYWMRISDAQIMVLQFDNCYLKVKVNIVNCVNVCNLRLY